MSRNKGITYVYTLFFKPRGQKARFISKFTLKLWNALTVKGNDLTMERSDWNPKRGSTPVSTVRLFIKNIFLIIDCKTVRIFAYSSTREQSNKRSATNLKTESETGERR